MNFAGMQKLTLLDYPGKVACIVFTKGCNFRCPFCHNASLVEGGQGPLISGTEVLAFLSKRMGVLEGICISGGEPLLQKDIADFMRKVKKLGYAIKLDTNGSNPEILKELIREGLVDYVAMDIKNSFAKYDQTCGTEVDISKIKKSIEILKTSGIDYEFRTTLVNELHTLSDVEEIGKELKGNSKYFLQSFVDSGDILCPGMSAIDEKTVKKMEEKVRENLPNAVVRGI